MSVGTSPVAGRNRPEVIPSRPCTQEQLESSTFRRWATEIGEDPNRLHRKIWEFCYIADVLHESGMLAPGKRGLGFAVGLEPLPSLFARFGATIVATDIDAPRAQASGWIDAHQHASGLDSLNLRGLCPDDRFQENCSFRVVDMNQVPDDLRDFDFVWSACAFEHLGTLDNGALFVRRAMRCLKPGGIAVHTTELNCSSDDSTLTSGQTVIYRRRDLEELAYGLTADGHHVNLNFDHGSLPADRYIDEPPYHSDVHLKLLLEGFVSTSYGITVRASTDELG